MCKVFLLILLLYSALEEVLLECQTSSGEIGQCVSIFSCPSLLRAFENPKKGYQRHLKKLKCTTNNTVGLSVCCRDETKKLVFENNTYNTTFEKVETHENLASCGRQDYVDDFTKQGIITAAKFPWLVGILTSQERYKSYASTTQCSGSLVNARYVLTTAEDLSGITRGSYYYVRVSEFAINALNCTDLTMSYLLKACLEYTDYDVERRILHPFYDSATQWNNIALLRLATVVSFKYYNRPICLPLLETKTPQVGDLLSLSSWNKTIRTGLIRDKEWSFQKNLSVKLMPKEHCTNVFNTTVANDRNYMCVSIIDDTNTTEISCTDIIGSQITMFDGTQWNLEGISNLCANNGSTITYTRIVKHMPWILQNIQSEQCKTPNGTLGECTYLTECPELMDAFANPQTYGEQFLLDFVCDSTINYRTFRQEFKIWENPLVCCGSLNINFDEKQTKELTVDPDLYAPKSLSEYCGYQNRDGYFLEKDNITTDEFPWVATIYRIRDRDKLGTDSQNIDATKYSGVLITSRYVVTGSYALNEFSWEDLLDVVRLGEYKLENKEDCLYFQEFDAEDCSNTVNYRVEKTITHPFFNFYNNLNDIALLRLDRAVEFTDYIRPICLPKLDFNLEAGEIVYGTGFGFHLLNWNRDIIIKKKISNVYLSNEECRKKSLLSHKKFISTHHMCATYLNSDTDFTCTGDNGGPLMATYKRRWYLAGILSETTCEYKWPQIYTRISKYLPWIYDTIMQTKAN